MFYSMVFSPRFGGQGGLRPSGTSSAFTGRGATAQILDRLLSESGTGEVFPLSAPSRVALAEALSIPGHAARESAVFEALGRGSGVLASRIGSEALRELIALSREGSEELYGEEVFRLAQRLEAQGRIASALALCDFLLSAGAIDLPSALAQRVSRSREAMLGRGEIGDRFEAYARRFTAEATDPGMLVGMAAASTVFSFTRMALLSRLWASPTAGFLTRGAGSRLLASGLALLPESGVFWLTSKGYAELTRPGGQDWSLRQNLSEWRSLALGLGMMRASGFAFRRLHLGFRGDVSRASLAGSSSFESALLHQGAMFAGILGSHALEAALGWARPRSLSDNVVDSLATLLHFNVAGRISARMSPGLHRSSREAELLLLRQENLQFRSWRTPPGGGEGRRSGAIEPAFAAVAAGLTTRSEGEVRPTLPEHVLAMSATEPGEGPKRSSSSSSWNFGSILPPAAPPEGGGMEGQGEAQEWLRCAVSGETEATPLHRVLQWFDYAERRQIVAEALGRHDAGRLMTALAGRVTPKHSRAERLAAIGLMHMMVLERPGLFQEVKSVLGGTAPSFSLDPQVENVWRDAHENLRRAVAAFEGGALDREGLLAEVRGARIRLDRYGHPHPLVSEMLDALPGLSQESLNFRKYSFLTSLHLAREVFPAATPVGEYLQTSFFSERALGAGEWIFARDILRHGRERLSEGTGASPWLSGDIARRETALMSAVADLIGLEGSAENPFHRYDDRTDFSKVSLLRQLNARRQQSYVRGRTDQAEAIDRRAAEIFDRDIAPAWLEGIPEPEIRRAVEPHFRQISEYLGRRGEAAPAHWPSLLGQISEPLLASSNPEQAFQILRDLHRMGVVPAEAWPDTVISLVTAAEIQLHQVRGGSRAGALGRTRSLLSSWSESL